MNTGGDPDVRADTDGDPDVLLKFFLFMNHIMLIAKKDLSIFSQWIYVKYTMWPLIVKSLGIPALDICNLTVFFLFPGGKGLLRPIPEISQFLSCKKGEKDWSP